jgi:hypothetical protein
MVMIYGKTRSMLSAFLDKAIPVARLCRDEGFGNSNQGLSVAPITVVSQVKRFPDRLQIQFNRYVYWGDHGFTGLQQVKKLHSTRGV